MAYLNNSTIVVDAVLTKKGRELLAANGGLNITSFALADDEIDYTLYQPNHPRGSAYYDVAIRNMPVLEAITDETQLLKYKLVTLAPGITTIPVISLGQQSIVVSATYKGQTVIVPSTNPSYNTTLGYTAILSNKNVGTIVGQGLSANAQATIPVFLGDVSSTTAQVVTGLTFTFVPNSSLTSNTSTRLTVIGNESGGSVSIPVTVLATTIAESSLSQL
jgi:hypothetical protein